jgi:hypothetical protein
MRRSVSMLAVALAAALTGGVVAYAQQASAPRATTGAATSIRNHSAVLNGSVTPNGADTTWYFEYGTTTAYGTRTPARTVNRGQGTRSVSATITGLSSGTLYHYRLVASNSAGTTAGVDRTFTTRGPAPVLTVVSLRSSPNPTRWGTPVVLSGQVAGSNNSGVPVALQARPYPYTGAFAEVARTTTDAAGRFTFGALPLVNTQYRAVARRGGNNFVSPVLLQRVRIRVSTNVSDRTPRRGQLVRFYGSARPPHAQPPGTVGVLNPRVRVQRLTRSGDWVTVARTRLRYRTPARSAYSVRVRIRTTGYYRVRVSTPDADHLSGIGTRRRLRVH